MGYRKIEPRAVHIDTLAEECGLFTSDTEQNNRYGCKSKSKNKQHRGCCYTFDCPLGYEMDSDDAEWDDSYEPGYWVLQIHEVV